MWPFTQYFVGVHQGIINGSINKTVNDSVPSLYFSCMTVRKCHKLILWFISLHWRSVSKCNCGLMCIVCLFLSFIMWKRYFILGATLAGCTEEVFFSVFTFHFSYLNWFLWKILFRICFMTHSNFDQRWPPVGHFGS